MTNLHLFFRRWRKYDLHTAVRMTIQYHNAKRYVR